MIIFQFKNIHKSSIRPNKFSKYIIIISILYLLGFASCAQYAILYTGSLEFFNYRNQGIFTIYNQLLSRGFTANNIELYAYYDIATDPENVYPGQLFHSIDHKVNVYPGSSAINVSGDDVTSRRRARTTSSSTTTIMAYRVFWVPLIISSIMVIN